MRELLTISIAAFFLSVTPGSTYAQTDCEGVLVPQVTVENSSRDVKLAWLKLATYDQFTQRNQKGSLNAVFDGLPIGASASDFQQNKTSYLQQENFSYDDLETRSIFHRGLSDAQVSAWATCKASVTPGVYMMIRNVATDTDATLTVLYVAAPGDTGNIALSVSNGTIDNAPSASVSLPTGARRTFLLRKTRREDRMLVIGNASSGGRQQNSSDAVFPRYIMPPPPPTACTAPVEIKPRSATATANSGGAAEVINGAILPNFWNSGRDEPVSLTIELPGPTFVSRIELYPQQADPNPVTNRFVGLNTAGQTVVLGQRTDNATSGQSQTFIVDASVGKNLRSVTMEAIDWRNWIAVHEIRVFGCR